MIQLYMTPRYEASIKARKWLRKQGLIYQEINLLKQSYHLRESLYRIIPVLDGGVLEIISTRSKSYKPLEKTLDNLSFSQLIDYLVSNPRLIRQPIIYDGVRVQVGFNPDEIRTFIPRQVRQLELGIVKDRIEKNQIIEKELTK